MPTRWVGIDEAGYGPNLGPLVMSAVVAETIDDRPPDLWGDLAASVSRAGVRNARLWVDDSKRIYQAGVGRDRLEAACLATVHAAGAGRPTPSTLGALLDALSAGTLDDVELGRWLDRGDPAFPSSTSTTRAEDAIARSPFATAPWRIVRVTSAVVGPSRFNAGLERWGSKATVHFATFASLLDDVWGYDPAENVTTYVRGDKHGGRHYYADPLASAFPHAVVTSGVEGPERSQYHLGFGGRGLALTLEPRADANDGLVALASIVSKTVREAWMEAFNAYWCLRIPGLKPTAGYPSDAKRFRRAIEPHCETLKLQPIDWWRLK